MTGRAPKARHLMEARVGQRVIRDRWGEPIKPALQGPERVLDGSETVSAASSFTESVRRPPPRDESAGRYTRLWQV